MTKWSNNKLFFIDYSSLRAGFMLKGLQNCNSHFLGRGREKSLQKCKMQCQHFPLSHSLVLENVLLNSVPSIYYIYIQTLKIASIYINKYIFNFYDYTKKSGTKQLYVIYKLEDAYSIFFQFYCYFDVKKIIHE